MFNFLKRLFQKKPLIDRIIDVTNVNNIEFWNCIDYDGSYDIPTTSRKPKSWKDENFQWIRVGFGVYSAGLDPHEASHPIIEIWVDKHMNIVRYEREQPIIPNNSRIGKKFEKQIDDLYSKLADQHKFVTNNKCLYNWVDTMMKLAPVVRYSMCLKYRGIATYNYKTLEGICLKLIDSSL